MRTKAGLKVFACIFNRIYETGRKVVEGFKESLRIVFDKHLGQWNYVAMPEATILYVAQVISCSFLSDLLDAYITDARFPSVRECINAEVGAYFVLAHKLPTSQLLWWARTLDVRFGSRHYNGWRFRRVEFSSVTKYHHLWVLVTNSVQQMEV